MPKLKTPEQLKTLLSNVKWEHFLHKNSSLKIKKVRFHARIALHMGRPTLAIIAQGQFVVMHHIKLDMETPNNLRVRLFGGIITDGISYYLVGGGPVLTTSRNNGYTLMTALSPYYGSDNWNRQILNVRLDDYVVPREQLAGPRHDYSIRYG